MKSASRGRVEFSATNDAATVGIDTSDSRNGAITYFFVNPSDLAYAWSYSTLQQATITFTLSKGDASRTWTPARTTTIPWDKSRVAALLEEQAQKITLTFSEGESAEAVTSSFSLPTKVPGASWASVSWSSNSDALKITGYSWGRRAHCYSNAPGNRSDRYPYCNNFTNWYRK